VTNQDQRGAGAVGSSRTAGGRSRCCTPVNGEIDEIEFERPVETLVDPETERIRATAQLVSGVGEPFED